MFYIKEAGHTMVQTMDKFKKDNNINNKVCYCGRLDPMARGLVLLLVGDDCKKMDEYMNTKKEYEFEILFGLSTDTDDPLGIINNTFNYSEEEVKFYYDKIKEYIIIGSFEQKFHNYSSKRVNGTPLWEYTKNNILVNVSHKVEIFDIKYNQIKKYNFNEWKDNILTTINKIDKKNDFRQDIIINNYNSLNINNMNNIIYSIPIRITVSSGFYVRQLVADIKTHFNIVVLTFDINRTNIY